MCFLECQIPNIILTTKIPITIESNPCYQRKVASIYIRVIFGYHDIYVFKKWGKSDQLDIRKIRDKLTTQWLKIKDYEKTNYSTKHCIKNFEFEHVNFLIRIFFGRLDFFSIFFLIYRVNYFAPYPLRLIIDFNGSLNSLKKAWFITKQ